MFNQTNKYGNKRVVIDGVVYDSIAESRYVQEVLEPLRLAKEIKSWKREPLTIEFKAPNGEVFMTMRPDFGITNMDKSLEIHEVKSVATEKDPLYRQKRNTMFKFYGIGGNMIRYKRHNYKYIVRTVNKDF